MQAQPDQALGPAMKYVILVKINLATSALVIHPFLVPLPSLTFSLFKTNPSANFFRCHCAKFTLRSIHATLNRWTQRRYWKKFLGLCVVYQPPSSSYFFWMPEVHLRHFYHVLLIITTYISIWNLCRASSGNRDVIATCCALKLQTPTAWWNERRHYLGGRIPYSGKWVGRKS